MACKLAPCQFHQFRPLPAGDGRTVRFNGIDRNNKPGEPLNPTELTPRPARCSPPTRPNFPQRLGELVDPILGAPGSVNPNSQFGNGP